MAIIITSLMRTSKPLDIGKAMEAAVEKIGFQVGNMLIMHMIIFFKKK